MANNKHMTKRQLREEKKRKIRKRKRKRIVFLIIEILILIILFVIAYGIFKLGKLDHNTLDVKNLEVYKDNGKYTNIALFGLDSRNGELDGGVQSDCIMIASINNKTNDVKLVSVYRDTMLFQKNGIYNKANAAYNTGGPEEAISLLNRNFDLNIKNYVSVNFNALVKVIDSLGGIDINMTKEEAHWCNLYGAETARVIGAHWSDIKEKKGTHHLDGIHGVAYARIRYTSGNDFKRAQRQRIVLEKVAEKAKKANFLTLNEIVDDVFPMISTSFSAKEILGFAAHALDYNLVSTKGFPYNVTTSEDVKDHEGVSFVVPIGLEENVIQLHQDLFNDETYEPSEKVKKISEDIIYMTDVTPDNTKAMKSTFEGDIQDEGSE